MKNEKEKYKDTEFYQKFKEFFLSVEKYVSNSPLLFTNEQKEFLSGTYFGFFAKEVRKTIDKHINLLKDSSFYNKEIDVNDFIQKRLFVSNRGYNTTKKELGEILLVPIYTLFPFDNLRSNARLDYNYGNTAKIITTYEIKKGHKMIMFTGGKKNLEKMVFEGRMNSYLTNYRENQLIPAFSPYFYYKYDIDDIKLIENYYLDIVDNNFEKQSVNFYREHADVFNQKEPTNTWACGLVQENLKYYKEYIEDLMKRVIELFKGENEDKISNVNKALKGEWINLNNKYERMIEICEYQKKVEMGLINEDL